MKYLGFHNISSTQLDKLNKDSQQLAIVIATERALANVKAMGFNAYVLLRIRRP